MALSLAVVWKSEGIRNTLIIFGGKDIKHVVLLDYLETINWRMKYLNKSG